MREEASRSIFVPSDKPTDSFSPSYMDVFVASLGRVVTTTTLSDDESQPYDELIDIPPKPMDPV